MVIASPIGNIKIEDNGFAVTKVCITSEEVCCSENSHLQLECEKQLNEYFKGKRINFELPIELIGTEFQKNVWNALLDIPYGGTMTYGEVAGEIGNASASRAVGGACNKNPIMIIVPCHRVIGANGKLTGFAHGTEMKEYLLKLESINKHEVLDV